MGGDDSASMTPLGETFSDLSAWNFTKRLLKLLLCPQFFMDLVRQGHLNVSLTASVPSYNRRRFFCASLRFAVMLC